MSKKIKLTKGKYTTVDDDDFEFLSQWRWFLSDGGYAHRSQHIRLGVNRYTVGTVRMHRVINQTPEGLFTDHINRDKLDNRRCNLRTVNKSLNSINRDKPKNNKSGYRGVYFDSWSKRWRAEIALHGKHIRLGRYVDIKDAVNARLLAEKQYYGI